MANDDRTDDDLLTSSEAHPDAGDLTPPHGDEVAPHTDARVNAERNASRRTPRAADDPDADRPKR